MQILVDADACPVVRIVEEIAKKYKIPVTLLCDTNHVLNSDYSEVIVVGAGADAVDFKLVSICRKGDIVVTQDYGVAAMALGKNAYVIHQSGKWYTNENIDQMLMERHLSKKARRASHKNHLRGPGKRTEEDDERFRESFEKMVMMAVHPEELFDICDEYGQPTGKTVARSIAHRDGIMHRTAHIWIVREYEGRKQILLQKRSMNKDSFPGCLDTSSAGHIQAGDEPLESARRELEEELGIHAQPEDLKPIGTFRISFAKEFRGKMFRDEEVAFVHVYEKPVDIEDLHLQKEELESVCWIDYEEVISAVRARDPQYCVPSDGLKMIGRYLRFEV